MYEPEIVRRFNLNTGLYHDMPLDQAMREIASKTGVDTFDSRLEIVAALCEGRNIEVTVHSYHFRD